MSALLGTGTTIAFGTSGFTADILEYAFSRISRRTVRTTHFLTPQAGAGQMGGHTYIPVKLVDPGYLVLTVAFNPQRPAPMHGVPETITLTCPLAHALATPDDPWTFTGFLTDWRIQLPVEAKMVASIEIKISGFIQLIPIEEAEILLSAEPWEMVTLPPGTLYTAEPWEA